MVENNINDENFNAPIINPPILSLSVLVTREEYGDAYIYRKCKQSKTTPLLMLLVAILLICFGVVGIFLNEMIVDFNFSFSIGITLIIAGIGGVFFSQFLMPMMYRGEAANEYDNRTDLQIATIYEFKNSPESGPIVRIKNGWTEGEIPVAFITYWIETPTFILFSISRELECAIPKRLLDEKQLDFLVGLLKKNVGKVNVC